MVINREWRKDFGFGSLRMVIGRVPEEHSVNKERIPTTVDG